MLNTVSRLANRIADYTIGTVIVLVHVAIADRRSITSRGLRLRA